MTIQGGANVRYHVEFADETEPSGIYRSEEISLAAARGRALRESRHGDGIAYVIAVDDTGEDVGHIVYSGGVVGGREGCFE